MRIDVEGRRRNCLYCFPPPLSIYQHVNAMQPFLPTYKYPSFLLLLFIHHHTPTTKKYFFIIPMAIKAALTAALLMALVALASATTFTTTVTTTSFEEEGNPRQQQCRQQLQGREFRSCQRYFSQRSSSPYEEEEEVLEMSTGRQTQHRQPHLNECCEQLREMDRYQCGCEAIKHAVQQAQQQQQGGRSRHQTGQSESEQIYQKARSLPRMCGLREQQCQFRVVLV